MRRRDLVLAGLAATGGAAAQEAWPSRPLRMVVPFAAGGATDLLTRIVTERLPAELGQPCVVENRGGAAGTIGAQIVASAPPDGYTLMGGAPGPLVVNQWVYKSLPHDPVRDFSSVVMVASIPYVLVVNPSLPVTDVQGFLAYARANPGKLNFGAAGSASRLTVELLRSMAGGLNVTFVSYRGASAARVDLLRGDIHFMLDQISTYQDDIRQGAVRPLGVGSLTPSAALPGVPTIDASGLPGYEAWAWLAFSASGGTPLPIRARLASAVDAILRQPEVRRRIVDLGADPMGGTPEQMDAVLTAERAKWGRIVRAAGIEPE